MASEELFTMSSEDKLEINSLIIDGLKVLNAPEDCLCSNCGLVAIINFTNCCSHLYCGTCYIVFKREKRNCRKCRIPVGVKTIEDDSIDMAIACLKTECPNRSMGCNEIVSIQQLLEHIKNCEIYKLKSGSEEHFSKTIECLAELYEAKLRKSNELFTTKLQETKIDFDLKLHETRNNFDFKLNDTRNDFCVQLQEIRNLFTEHTRKVVELCKSNDINAQKNLEAVTEMVEGRANELEKIVTNLENKYAMYNAPLEETCAKVDTVLKNIQSVDAVFLDQTAVLTNELNKCNKTSGKVNCALKEIKAVDAKLTTEKNIVDEYVNRIEKLESQLETIRKEDVKKQLQIKSTIDAFGILNYNDGFVWKIGQFDQKKKLAKSLYSKYFYTSGCRYKMRLMIIFNENAVGVHLHFEPGVQEDYLSGTFYQRRIFFILDQSDLEEKNHISSVAESSFRDSRGGKWMKINWGFPDLCPYHLLEGEFKNVYLKNDEMFVKVVVGPAFDCTINPFSYNGILIWKVSEYQKTKKNSLEQICTRIESESFYSSRDGYRMRAILPFTETHLFLQLKMLVGEFDDALSDIFAHKVTFSILDQNNLADGENGLRLKERLDPKEIGDEKAKERMSSSDCYSVHFSYTDFEKLPFLVDDSIVIQVVVKPI